MKAVFPGKPQAKLQACSTALWEGQRIVTYISQNALVILGGPNDLIQTTQHDESEVLEAVAINEASGKIAACTNRTVFLYSPFGQDLGALKWSLQHTIIPENQNSSLTSLSWGFADEILVAGSALTIFSTGQVPRKTWTKELANPAKFAAFTPDANFIATTGQYDRLVKIWRRQFLGGEDEEERFDVSYLAHPSAVTSLRWHRRRDQDHHSDTVLYTTCGDSKLRIWATTDHHGLQALQLWSELDLNDCIVPRSPVLPSDISRHFIFIIDGWEFETMIEDAIHQGIGGERGKHTREHLSDVAYRNPDVCVVMDDRGNMSAWGLERVGCKAREPSDIFNIVLAEGLGLISSSKDNAEANCVSFCSFAGIKDGKLNVLANLFNGTIEWLSSSVDRFFDPSASIQRFQLEAVWTGHAEPIDKLISSANSNTVLSTGLHQEVVVWNESQGDAHTTLSRHSTFMTQDKEQHVSLFFEGRYAAFAFDSRVEIRNIEKSVGIAHASYEFSTSTALMCLVALPRNVSSSGDEYVVAISDKLQAIAYRVSFDEDKAQISIEHFTEFDIPKTFKEQTFQPTRSCERSSTAKSIAYSVSSSGSLTLWHADLNISNKTFALKPHSTTLTGVTNPYLIQVGAYDKAALVASTGTDFTVWDLRLGHLELHETFPAHETIEAIDVVLTSSEGSLLAIAFSHKVLVYIQDRYSSGIQSAAWVLARTVDIGNSTNVPIADCIWLANHELLVAAGNQAFLFDNQTNVPDTVFSAIEVLSEQNASASFSAVTAALNGVPAVFSPVVLSQIFLAGNIELVDWLLNTIRGTLKFWSKGDELDSQLGLVQFHSPSSDSSVDGTSDVGSISPEQDPFAIFSQEAAIALSEIVDSTDLPYISMMQQRELSSLGESLGSFESYRHSMDSFAARYIVHLHLLNKLPLDACRQVPWRYIALASHSTSQDVMIDLTTKMYQGRMLWKDAKESGMFVWISDIEALRNQFEVVGRNEYTKTDEKNPIDCSLYYLALKKKQVLVGLWRMATWNREQGPTLRLLGNNFNDPRWKTAALKNAYALLGLRRFEYAAAFFLLADCPKDAVNVLASQLKDIQLAIAIARVYEGDDGPVLKELLREKILPEAAREGNRWLATYAFWLLKQKAMAIRALTDPLHELIDLREPATMQSKHFSNNEPALVHLYSFLRDQSQRDPREPVALSPKAEWDLVMRSAMSYVRAGCHILALDLVRNWEFRHNAPPPKRLHGTSAAGTLEAQTSADEDRADSGETGWLADKLAADLSVDSTKPQRKKVVEEPSTASIFDNFDF